MGKPKDKKQFSKYQICRKVKVSSEFTWRFHETVNPTKTIVINKNIDPDKPIKFSLYLLLFKHNIWEGGCIETGFSGLDCEGFIWTWSAKISLNCNYANLQISIDYI